MGEFHMSKIRYNENLDYYSDDPIEPVVQASNRRFPGISTILILALISGTLINTTLASNISLSGSNVEFGQGTLLTTPCTNNDVITITPQATFTNQSGAGVFYFSSLTLSGIPSSCNGVDFRIKAYDNTSATPIALYNTNSTEIVVTDTSGNYTSSNTGLSVATNSSTALTITFTNPVALSTSVFKITLESGPGTTLSCANGGTCTLSAWTEITNGGTGAWYRIAGATDNSKMIKSNYVSTYLSGTTDGGENWSYFVSAGSAYWEAVASSADGATYVAATYGGHIFTSIDSGINWVDRSSAGSRNWRSLSCNSDCSQILATTDTSKIYISNDTGATWTDRSIAGSHNWMVSASSSDGVKLVIGDYSSGYIYTSTDSGVTWNAKTNSGARQWMDVSLSGNGNIIAAVTFGNGNFYRSTDFGETWSTITIPGSTGQTSKHLTMSSDGSKIVITKYDSEVYISTNSGSTWLTQSPAAGHYWYVVKITADGSRIIIGRLAAEHMWKATIS
jgi:photosystem II stability/assembly factor-like uncharacterized protein